MILSYIMLLIYSQLDLRVNHTLIKDQFLWVSLAQLLHPNIPNYCYLSRLIMKLPAIQDLNNYESDPEEFSRIFCKDLAIQDPEVGVSNLFTLYVTCKVNC